MGRRVLAGIGVLLVCASCASVVADGRGGFVVTKQGLTGASDPGELRRAVLIEASLYCSSLRRDLHITGLTESRPPYTAGTSPRVELTFECLPDR